MDKKPTQHEELAGRTAVLNTFLAASVAQNSKLEERRLSSSFLNGTALQSQKFQVGRSEEPSANPSSKLRGFSVGPP